MAAQCKLYRRENSVRIPGNQWRVSPASWPGIVPVPRDNGDHWPMSPGPWSLTISFCSQNNLGRAISTKGSRLNPWSTELFKLIHSKYFREYWEYDVKWELMEHHPEIQPTVRLLMDHRLRVSETLSLCWMYPSASPASFLTTSHTLMASNIKLFYL